MKFNWPSNASWETLEAHHLQMLLVFILIFFTTNDKHWGGQVGQSVSSSASQPPLFVCQMKSSESQVNNKLFIFLFLQWLNAGNYEQLEYELLVYYYKLVSLLSCCLRMLCCCQPPLLPLLPCTHFYGNHSINVTFSKRPASHVKSVSLSASQSKPSRANEIKSRPWQICAMISNISNFFRGQTIAGVVLENSQRTRPRGN